MTQFVGALNGQLVLAQIPVGNIHGKTGDARNGLAQAVHEYERDEDGHRCACGAQCRRETLGSGFVVVGRCRGFRREALDLSDHVRRLGVDTGGVLLDLNRDTIQFSRLSRRCERDALVRRVHEILMLFHERPDFISEFLILRRNLGGVRHRPIRVLHLRIELPCEVLEVRRGAVALQASLLVCGRRKPQDSLERDVLFQRVDVELRNQFRDREVCVRDFRQLAPDIPERAVVVHRVDDEQQHQQRRESSDFSGERPSQLKSVRRASPCLLGHYIPPRSRLRDDEIETRQQRTRVNQHDWVCGERLDEARTGVGTHAGFGVDQSRRIDFTNLVDRINPEPDDMALLTQHHDVTGRRVFGR